MISNFFKKSKKKEQQKRHLNNVFQLYFLKYIDDNHVMSQVVGCRNSYGYEKAFDLIHNNYMQSNFRNYLIYLKNRYGVSDDELIEIIGMKEINHIIKTPSGYSKEEEFIFIFHLLIISTIEGFTHQQNVQFSKIIKGLNYKKEHIDLIISSFDKHNYLWKEYKDTEKIEALIIGDFLSVFKYFPN